MLWAWTWGRSELCSGLSLFGLTASPRPWIKDGEQIGVVQASSPSPTSGAATATLAFKFPGSLSKSKALYPCSGER